LDQALVVDTELLQCNGTAERDAAMLMAERLPGTEPVTLAGDKGYDTKDSVQEMRGIKVTPHVSQNLKRAVAPLTGGRRDMSAMRSANAWRATNPIRA
jgi:hypothetical protein